MDRTIHGADIVSALMEARPKDFKSRAAAERTVRGVFDQIALALENHDNVTISGFGSFIRVERSERQARSPISGEPVLVPAHSSARLKVSGKLKKRLNEKA